MTRTGGCLCGAVRYEISGPDPAIDICHCAMCRRQGGHAQAAMVVAREHFRWTCTEGLAWYRSSDHGRRPFCSRCGSALGFEEDGDDAVYPNAGSLDDGGQGLTIRSHIYTASKGAYYTIGDDAPQHAKLRPQESKP
jgi:hypothetical protein